MNKVKPPGGYPRTTGKKWCRVCDKKKEAEEFNSDRNSWDGLQPKCKTCSSKLNKSAYQEKAEVLKARRRERYRLQKEAKLRSTNPHKAGDKSKAVHAGHLDVHKEECVASASRHLQPFFRRACQVHLVSRSFKNALFEHSGG